MEKGVRATYRKSSLFRSLFVSARGEREKRKKLMHRHREKPEVQGRSGKGQGGGF